MPNINGIGVSDWVEIFDIFLAYNEFNADDWVYVYGGSSDNGFQASFWKNPFKLSFEDTYIFNDAEGYYFATDPTKEGLPNGYRYIAYMFVGIAPESMAWPLNTGSSRPGYGTSELYYPVNMDDLLAGYNQAGYALTFSKTSKYCNILECVNFMTGTYDSLQPICINDYSYGNQQMISYAPTSIYAIPYESVLQSVKDKFGITDSMIGYTPEAIEACIQAPKPPNIVNDGYPLCWFQTITGLPDTSIEDTEYRPLKVVSGADGHRKFYYKDSRILMPNTGNISYNPFNVLITQGNFVSEADSTNKYINGCVAIIFQGVEPII